MSLAQSMLAEFEEQAPITRRFLERLPEDRLTWKPHEKSMSAGQLAYHLAFVPGFHKDTSGNIFQTYSTYGRGLDELLGPYIFLDRVPKGRDEAAITPHPMAWVRHHDRYSPNYFAEPAESAAGAKSSAAGCCADHS